MQRWTIEMLDQTDDLSFAAAILTERRDALANPQSPLYRKLDQAISWLNQMKATAPPPEPPEETVYAIVQDFSFKQIVVSAKVRRRGGGVIELEHEESPLMSMVYTFPEDEWGKSIFEQEAQAYAALGGGDRV
ncbi:MAG: hypothetical protein ACLSUM_15370 [Dysosmobacter welbionis]